MPSVADAIWIKLGLDTGGFSKDLNNAVGEVQKNADALKSGADGVTKSALGKISSVAKMFLAPLAGAMSMSAMLKSYFSGVAQVAQMTGAYSPKLEEWRKKRALLARTTREDIQLYKQNREALTKFNISMADLSAKIVRVAHPAIRLFNNALNKFSDWVDRHADDIVRFLKITASVLTVALIPAIIRMLPLLKAFALRMLANPLTWIIVALGALVLLIDDLVVWLNNGNSALGKFWEKLGSRKELLEYINNAFTFMKEHIGDVLKVLGYLAGGFVALKVASIIFGGLIKVVSGFITVIGVLHKALLFLCANPIIAFLSLLLSIIMWVKSAWDRAGQDWSKVVGIMKQDVIDFLNHFGGLGDKLAEFHESVIQFGKDAVQWFSDVGKSIKESIEKAIASAKNVWNNFCDTIERWYNKIISFFTDIGKKIKEAFSFDNIKKQLDGILKKLNPANWFSNSDEAESAENGDKKKGFWKSLFGGDDNEQTSKAPLTETVADSLQNYSDAISPSQRAQSAELARQESVNNQSNKNINNNININTDSPAVARAVVDEANDLAGDSVYQSSYQSNLAMS